MLSRSIWILVRRSSTQPKIRPLPIRPGEDRPELDFDYLLDPSNLPAIRANISNRKQVGDIDHAHGLWNRLNSYLGKSTSSESTSLKPTELKALWDDFYDACSSIPNRTHADSPLGDESQARLVETRGQTLGMNDFKHHPAEDIAVMIRGIRYASTDIGTMAGDKAYFIHDTLSILEKALINYALSIVQRRQFQLIYVPDVINVDIPRKCGLMSRTDKSIIYTIKNTHQSYCLSGTGEMGVASYLENRTFHAPDQQMPKRFVTISRCFRPEVSDGRISRGLYRVHEFTKVEMFAVTVDDELESETMLNEFVDIQKEIFDGLKLHYRIMDMPTRELGAPAYRKFDIEAWMPGRGIYGEISSASNCTDYQSRRLKTKYETTEGKTRFVHTINGTACATSRLLIALIEQHQQKNKLVLIPDALKPFFNNWPALFPHRQQLKIRGVSPRKFSRYGDISDKER